MSSWTTGFLFGCITGLCGGPVLVYAVAFYFTSRDKSAALAAAPHRGTGAWQARPVPPSPPTPPERAA